MSVENEGLDPSYKPDTEVEVKTVFGIDAKMKVPAFKAPNEYVPDRDEAYRFDRETTLAILAGSRATAA